MNVANVDFAVLAVQANPPPQVSENAEQSFSSCLRNELSSSPQTEIAETGIAEAGITEQITETEITSLAFIYPKFGNVRIDADGENAVESGQHAAEQEVFRNFPSKRALSEAGTEAGTTEGVAEYGGTAKTVSAAEGGKRPQKADAERKDKRQSKGVYGTYAVLPANTGTPQTQQSAEFSKPAAFAEQTAVKTAEIFGVFNASAKSDFGAKIVTEAEQTAVPQTAGTSVPEEKGVKSNAVSYSEIFAKDIVSVRAVKIPAGETAQFSETELKAASYAKPVIRESAELNELLTGKSAEFREKPEIPANAEKPAAEKPLKQEKSAETENSGNEKGDGAVTLLNPAERDISAKPEPLKLEAQIAKPIFENLSKIAKTAKTITRFEITLNPANLGKVTVKLIAKSAGIAVEIIADNPKTRELLAERIGAVRANLENQGVTVEKYEVFDVKTYETAEKYRDFSEDGGGNRQNQNESGDSDEKETDETEVSFAEVVNSII